jgi:anti-sigma factor RsiW
MTRASERELMRLLWGELPEESARALRQRLAADPELAGAYRRLTTRWQGLELPPPAPVPLGFAARLAARARAQGRPQAGLRAAPLWVRAAAALALATGLALGAGVGLLQATASEDGLSAWGVSLAESYWEAIEGEPADAAEVAR